MLKARFEAILEVAENAQGDLIRADEAEQRAIEPRRQLGNEVLPDWAEQRVAICADELKKKEKNVVGLARHGAKSRIMGIHAHYAFAHSAARGTALAVRVRSPSEAKESLPHDSTPVRTFGKKCLATRDYSPSLRSPWLAANGQKK